MYCDDQIGVSSRDDWLQDRSIAVEQLTKLFGKGAYANEKSDSTEAEGKLEREIVLLGWTINLTTNRVMVSRRNQLRAMRAFFVVDLDLPLSIKNRERLCSLAERYSSVFHEMKVLMCAMYRMLGAQDKVSGYQLIPLSDSARSAINIWRMVLLVAEYDLTQGCINGRDIAFFAPSSVSSCIIEYDGSPYGLGWRLFPCNSSECEYAGAVALLTDFFPNGLFKSNYQNGCEFSALVCGLVHMIHIGFRNCSIVVRGDSNTVCHWTESDHFNQNWRLHQ